jgi:hypothetical protein
VANAGWAALQLVSFFKTLLGLFLSPLGLLAGLGLMHFIRTVFDGATPRINVLFRQFQLFTTLGLAFTVGSNDAQKFMGLVTLALVLAEQLAGFEVPLWVLLASATTFAFGMLSGGYRLIKTIGGHIFTLRPAHSLSAQLAAGLVVLVASLTGLPVSSTQVVSTSVFGVGAAERPSKVRWQVAREMLSAWALTIPVTPIDREDLFSLSRAIDDVLDYADTTVDEMVLLGVQPNPFLIRMVSLLREASEEINRGVQRLMDRPNIANDHAVRAKALENRVESVYREAIGALFSGPRDVEHIVEMLKLREIYRHLSNAADRGDEAANVIEDIVVKQM